MNGGRLAGGVALAALIGVGTLQCGSSDSGGGDDASGSGGQAGRESGGAPAGGTGAHASGAHAGENQTGGTGATSSGGAAGAGGPPAGGSGAVEQGGAGGGQCDADTEADPQNCGSCGHVCGNANGTAACVDGECVIDCRAGWGDCDGDRDTGCEQDLESSALHCGECAHVCDDTNGTPSCDQAACRIECDEGAGNCDGDISNGCETLLDSVEHCGACDHACSTENGTPGCEAATCVIACDPGFDDCDADPLNGCEVDIRADPLNCSACGVVCPSTGGIPGCVEGACTLPCYPGFGDCDLDAATGCETDLRTISSCGSCFASCSGANGTPGCSADGECTIACAAGSGDCDGDARTNGCETDTTSSVDHCGGCGQACAGRSNVSIHTCVNSGCTIGACSSGWYDQNGTYADGCECAADAVADVASSATDLGVIELGTSLVRRGNLTPTPTDTDFYLVTFGGTSACTYSPQINLTSGSDVYIRVVGANGNEVACRTGGTASGGGLTSWDFTLGGSACGDHLLIDSQPDTGSFVMIPTAFYVQVYTTRDTATCAPYELTITN